MTKLSKPYRKIAKEAGFIFWKKEPHGPGKGHIDWANNYDAEMERYSKALVNAVLDEVGHTFGKRDWQLSLTLEKVRERFEAFERL